MQVNKLISACLCSTAWGQAVMGAIINPPKSHEPSYELYQQERSSVVNRLREKANLVTELFNSVEGVQCNTVMGSVFFSPAFDEIRSKLEIEGFHFILEQCTLFHESRFLRKLLILLSQKILLPMHFTAFNYWRKLVSVLFPVVALNNDQEHIIFEQQYYLQSNK